MVTADRSHDHRADGHIRVVLSANGAARGGALRSLVVSRALRSFLVEPRLQPAPPPLARDWVLVAVLVVAGVLEVVLGDVAWPGVALIAGVGPAVCLPWRRTRPVLVAAVVTASVVVGDAVMLLGTGELIDLSAMVYVLLAPYALLRWGSGGEAAAGMAVVLAIPVFATIAGGDLGDLALGLPFFSLSAALGAALRYRARSRLGEADRIRLREREQLARELHDTVAHHVSAIAIRAQAGRTLAPTQPEAAVAALEVIEEAASRTLADLRELVGALRDRDEADLAPQRGVADIARLAHRPGDGPRIDVQLAGDLDGVRPLVGAAIYRIAQESVTNALRHARHATRIDVHVDGRANAVRLTVHDDGDAVPSGAEHSAGFGLVGMGERAALVGGTLQAGPGADRGWTVAAVLPRDGSAA
jgi:signal transduction histidine kinase